MHHISLLAALAATAACLPLDARSPDNALFDINDRWDVSGGTMMDVIFEHDCEDDGEASITSEKAISTPTSGIVSMSEPTAITTPAPYVKARDGDSCLWGECGGVMMSLPPIDITTHHTTSTKTKGRCTKTVRTMITTTGTPGATHTSGPTLPVTVTVGDIPECTGPAPSQVDHKRDDACLWGLCGIIFDWQGPDEPICTHAHTKTNSATATIPECPEETPFDFPFGGPGPVIVDRDDDGCQYGVCGGLTMSKIPTTPKSTGTPSAAVPSCTPKRKTATHSVPHVTSTPTCRPRIEPLTARLEDGPAQTMTAGGLVLKQLPYCDEIEPLSSRLSAVPSSLMPSIVSDVSSAVGAITSGSQGLPATYKASHIGSVGSFVTSVVSAAPSSGLRAGTYGISSVGGSVTPKVTSVVRSAAWPTVVSAASSLAPAATSKASVHGY